MNKLDSYFLCIYLLQKQGTFSYAVLLIVTYLCKTDTIFTLEKKENKAMRKQATYQQLAHGSTRIAKKQEFDSQVTFFPDFPHFVLYYKYPLGIVMFF
jgi:hypothetical protein